MLPSGEWLTIVSYRDFYDFPRLTLVANRESKFWILDSDFDDEQDEYSDNYKVYFLGNDSSHAMEAFDLHAKGARGGVVGVVPAFQIEFDATRRHELRLKIS